MTRSLDLDLFYNGIRPDLCHICLICKRKLDPAGRHYILKLSYRIPRPLNYRDGDVIQGGPAAIKSELRPDVPYPHKVIRTQRTVGVFCESCIEKKLMMVAEAGSI